MTLDWKNIWQQIVFALAKPIHPRGILWVGAAGAAALLSWAMGWQGAPFWFGMTVIFYICFRDPLRVPPAVTGVMVAPADGVLTEINREAAWPADSGVAAGTAQCITIRPRFYDVHVLRAPASGSLTLASHTAGQWGSPVFDKAAAGNERAVFDIKLPSGPTAFLEIIGGGAPERIRVSARTADVVTLAQPIAYAAFGGEVRLYLPTDVTLIAQIGQRMVAGETPVAATAA